MQTFFVTQDPDVLGQSLKADSPEDAAQRSGLSGRLTVRWNVRLDPTEEGGFSSAVRTEITTAAAPVAAAPVVASPVHAQTRPAIA